ncbi:hypothetical protein KUD11_03485 [Roseovarius sp. LXJ103]|uniref:hypothetical protein n=1 Tax=Roseovarius carneus TaxID=2853164 RepID=UPI0011B1EDE9|nr:hypothetical protein [Roseovarius carneus]MBZ8117706.1 hypothetical protein [Roseovarius carneus]
MRMRSAILSEFATSVLPVALAFVLAFRLIAVPLVLPNAADGTVTLCLGGKIVTINWDGPGTPKVTHDVCPAMGLLALVDAVAPLPPAPEAQLRPADYALMDPLAIRAHVLSARMPRAPPRAMSA